MGRRVLLIQPPFERLMGYSRYYTNIGLLSLAAVVREAGHEVLVYDSDYNPDGVSYTTLELYNKYDNYVNEVDHHESFVWDEIRKVISDFKPDCIGITVLTVTLDSARQVLRIAREINPNVCIFAGGVHASIKPNDLVNDFDYVIQYEGESVILDVIEGRAAEKVLKGQRIMKLDALPFPATDCLYGIEKYHKRDLSMVISTRGCPAGCKFCNSPVIWNRRVTRKSVSYFIKEIELLKNNYGIDDFFIADDSFSYDKRWLEEFCTEVKKLNVKWRCLDRIDYVTQNKLDIMMDAGCTNIKYGIESGSQRILNLINKHITVEDVYHASELLKKNNVNWGAFFIIGFTGETEEDIFQTRKIMEDISANAITLSIFTPYPGNQLYPCDDLEYKLFSHHSPNNNFTGVIPDERFHEIVLDTLQYVEERNKQYEKI